MREKRNEIRMYTCISLRLSGGVSHGMDGAVGVPSVKVN